MKEFEPGTIVDAAKVPGTCGLCGLSFKKGETFRFCDYTDGTGDFRAHIFCVENSTYNVNRKSVPVNLDNSSVLKIIREALLAAVEVIDRHAG